MAMNWPVQQPGANGEDVRTLQYLLDEAGATVGVDGAFGRVTREAVGAFQADHGLAVDGIVGDATWVALATPIQLNSTGHAVRAAQRQINRRTGRVLIDGVFQGQTDTAVRSFQECAGLTVDGVVGLQTWDALLSGYFISDDGEAAALQMFMAWRDNDQEAAKKNAAPSAVDALFERRWRKSDGWVFGSCDFVNGNYSCNWSRSGERLLLDANDNADQPFYFVAKVSFSSASGD
jgi:peptidoglycan hydrolase-like protein with peptidoglycan-binding domain